MVTRFLQSTRSSAFHPVPTDLEELVKEVVETFGKDPQYQEVVRVEVEFEDLAPVVLDREQMRQVLWNLLLNGAQAMPEGGQILVTGHRIGERLRLVVTDQGIGVAPENLERLFDPFYTTRVGGTGLGLATVERNVRAHNGEVWVQSEVGQGTTFAVWLPVSTPRAVVQSDEERARG
jgi:signal transduction histidine kinase